MNTHKHNPFSFKEARLIFIGEHPENNTEKSQLVAPEGPKPIDSNEAAEIVAADENSDLKKSAEKIQSSSVIKPPAVTEDGAEVTVDTTDPTSKEQAKQPNEFFNGIKLSEADRAALGKALAKVLEYLAKVLNGKSVEDGADTSESTEPVADVSEANEAEKGLPDKVRLQKELTKHVTEDGGAGVDSLIAQKETASAGIEENRVAVATEIEGLEDTKFEKEDTISDLVAQKTAPDTTDEIRTELDAKITALKGEVTELQTKITEKQDSLITLAKERDTAKEAASKDVSVLEEMQAEAINKHASFKQGLEQLQAIPNVEAISFLKGIALGELTPDLQINVSIAEDAAAQLKTAEQSLQLEGFDSTNPITDTEGFIAHITKVVTALLNPKPTAPVQTEESTQPEEVIKPEEGTELAPESSDSQTSDRPENAALSPDAQEFKTSITDAINGQKEFMEHVEGSLQNRITMYSKRIIDTQEDISKLEKQWFTGGTIKALKNTLQQEKQALQTAEQAMVEFRRVETNVNETASSLDFNLINSRESAAAVAAVNANNEALDVAFNMKNDPNYAKIGNQLQAAADSLAWADNIVDGTVDTYNTVKDGAVELGSDVLAYLKQIPGAASDIWNQDLLPALNSIKDSEVAQDFIAYLDKAIEGIKTNGIDGQVKELFAALKEIAAENGIDNVVVDTFIDSIEAVVGAGATGAEIIRESGEALYTGTTDNMGTTAALGDTIATGYENTVGYISSIPESAQAVWNQDILPAFKDVQNSTLVTKAGTIIGNTIANIEQNGIGEHINEKMIALKSELENVGLDQNTIKNALAAVNTAILNPSSAYYKKYIAKK